MTMTSQLVNMMSLITFFDVAVFLLSSLVTGPSLMLILSLVLELSKLSFTGERREIWKSEISPPEFCPKYGDTKFGTSVSN